MDTPLNAETLVVAIPGGTHCADMAPPAADDTPAMLQARARIKSKLLEWLKGFSEEDQQQHEEGEGGRV